MDLGDRIKNYEQTHPYRLPIIVMEKIFARTKWITNKELLITSKEQDFLLNIFTKEA